MLITEENFKFALQALSNANEIGVDTEGTGLNMRNKVDYMMGLCLSVEGFDCYMPFRHQEGNYKNLPMHYLHEYVVPLLRDKDLDWFHMKYDYHALKTVGVDPLEFKGIQFDSMLAAHMLDEESFSFDLATTAMRYIGEGKAEDTLGSAFHQWGDLFGYHTVPIEIAAPYGARDAGITRRLKRVLLNELKAQELTDVFFKTEMPFARLLYKLEQRGVGVDMDMCEQYYERGTKRMNTISRKLGFVPSSPKELKKFLIDELGLPVLKHTKKCDACHRYKRPTHSHDGPPSFDKTAMEEYDEILQAVNNPAAAMVAEFRGWQKASSSLYLPLLEKTGPDGLIRTEFKQHGTVTGRLSANDPNLQQVPRESNKPWNGKAKAAFHSGRDGFDLLGWDYSQLELRIGASYGQESVLLAEFEKPDADPFAAMAPLLFGEFTKETRQQTKTFTYSTQFGAGKPKVALQLGLPLSKVDVIYDNYKNSLPGMFNVAKQVARLMEQRGYIRYWDGRRRHMRNKSDSFKAWNSLCQGGGAQLVKNAMLRAEKFEDENCFMVLQVHDEITFCIRKGMRNVYEPLIVEAMTDWDMGVKLMVDGKAWGEE